MLNQYPHLFLVEDWMDEELTSPHPSTTTCQVKPTADTLKTGNHRAEEEDGRYIWKDEGVGGGYRWRDVEVEGLGCCEG